MFQKDQLQKLDNKYNSHAYTGLMGIFMKYCHQQLEKIEFPGNISKVLEIGAGSAPHINYVKHNFDEYHIIETSDFAINQNFSNSKIKITKYDGQNIPFPNETFERIIISHCLEHIPFPEKFLFEMMSKLKPGGILSISLPTDPGLLFLARAPLHRLHQKARTNQTWY